MDLDNINNLLAKEVDRKEFLAHIGATALAVIGVSGLIKAFTNPKGTNSSPSAKFSSQSFHTQSNSKPKTSRTTGYGSGSYGGV